ncbi:TRAM domain-containing protein [Methanosalsum natronophilum]|uniref:TRAM domain-containing protein n=1 Tax=Methanosalsum natronophilum TaxID=768733 RepID=UPI002168BB28|nr:TRAM domain-containing protein [Methanosalsum natronophilum]
MKPSAPVEAGKTYEVTIEDIAKEGDGIARVEGFVIFVPNTEVGDSVNIKVNRVMRKFAFGEVV